MELNQISKHEFAEQNGSFSYIKWKRLVETIVKDIDSHLEAIVPFGFELTGDKAYLSKKLRRFYIYIRNSKGSAKSEQLKKVVMIKLAEVLSSNYPEFFNTLYEIDIQNEKLKLSGENSKIIIYERNTKEKLINDWAIYLITTPTFILNGALPDIKLFEHNNVARSYIFQLSIIYHHLFEYAQITKLEYSTIRHLSTPYREGNQILIEDILYCKNIFESIVISQVNRIVSNHSLQSPDMQKIKIQDYHSEAILTTDFSKNKAELYMDKIATLYNSYGK